MLGAAAQITEPRANTANARRKAARAPRRSIICADKVEPMIEVATNRVVLQA
ncbi:hypothetical protein D3C79_940320 [compost metagenome]